MWKDCFRENMWGLNVGLRIKLKKTNKGLGGVQLITIVIIKIYSHTNIYLQTNVYLMD